MHVNHQWHKNMTHNQGVTQNDMSLNCDVNILGPEMHNKMENNLTLDFRCQVTDVVSH